MVRDSGSWNRESFLCDMKRRARDDTQGGGVLYGVLLSCLNGCAPNLAGSQRHRDVTMDTRNVKWSLWMSPLHNLSETNTFPTIHCSPIDERAGLVIVFFWLSGSDILSHTDDGERIPKARSLDATFTDYECVLGLGQSLTHGHCS